MRYALYFSPPSSSPLWTLGCRWLGNNPLTQKDIEQNHLPGIHPDRFNEITRTPRRYGFHATLKSPFRLVDNHTETDLRLAVNTFANSRFSFFIPPLTIRMMNGFFCLCPADQPSELDALANDCVRNFDSFRAPLTKIECAQRRAEISDSTEQEYLDRWGYPYVLNRFRFHITLTEKITNALERQLIKTALTDIFISVLAKPLEIDAVSLFVEPMPGHTFYCAERFPMRKIDSQNAMNSIVSKTTVLRY